MQIRAQHPPGLRKGNSTSGPQGSSQPVPPFFSNTLGGHSPPLHANLSPYLILAIIPSRAGHWHGSHPPYVPHEPLTWWFTCPLLREACPKLSGCVCVHCQLTYVTPLHVPLVTGTICHSLCDKLMHSFIPWWFFSAPPRLITSALKAGGRV